METELNPFHDLYVTETSAARPTEFVQLFSPFFIKNALLLFEPTNVVLKGTQGCGKSMLLNLLKPEIRVAYAAAEEEFPVPKRLCRFLGAGVNLTRSGVIDIGQRPISKNPGEDIRLFPLYFADFLNYLIVQDIIDSVSYMISHPEVFSEVAHSDRLDSFAVEVSRRGCWFGYLNGVRCLDDLKSRLTSRLLAYRQFHQFNISVLPEEIMATKSVIGEPISQTAECLTSCGILGEGVPVFVRIDQHEILCRSDDLRHDVGLQYRRILNKALSTRDPRVFYRIGTRRYAWDDDLTVFGTTSPLEWERDYKIIDLDELLRRKEDTRIQWVFPGFARDVFQRRLARVGLHIQGSKNMLRRVMGPSPKPQELVRKYVGSNKARRALGIGEDWPIEWKGLLERIFREKPLDAKLAQAWGLQRVKGGKSRHIDYPPPANAPWQTRPYWRKERIRQALFQLASSCGQRLLWWGEENILSLSMGSILVFVSICQHIWDTLFRFERGLPPQRRSNPLSEGIAPEVQAIAIQTASTRWYQKIAVEEAGGNDRQRFIDRLGQVFQNALYEDKAMSYPGHNSFSLLKEDFEKNQQIREFLSDAVDYGDLYDAAHTTKTKDRRQRIKWYLHPILSPHFKIPESHIKEPMYVTSKDILGWVGEAKIMLRERRERRTYPIRYSDTKQLSLFPKSEK